MIETLKASREWGIGREYPLPSRLGSLGSVVSSPSGVRGRTPAKNDLTAYRVSERRSLQRLLKINVVR